MRWIADKKIGGDVLVSSILIFINISHHQRRITRIHDITVKVLEFVDMTSDRWNKRKKFTIKKRTKADYHLTYMFRQDL